MSIPAQLARKGYRVVLLRPFPRFNCPRPQIRQPDPRGEPYARRTLFIEASLTVCILLSSAVSLHGLLCPGAASACVVLGLSIREQREGPIHKIAINSCG